MPSFEVENAEMYAMFQLGSRAVFQQENTEMQACFSWENAEKHATFW